MLVNIKVATLRLTADESEDAKDAVSTMILCRYGRARVKGRAPGGPLNRKALHARVCRQTTCVNLSRETDVTFASICAYRCHNYAYSLEKKYIDDSAPILELIQLNQAL